VDLKKKRVGYPSVMHIEGRLASGPDHICNLFADFIQHWVPSDSETDLVQDVVQSVLLELDVSDVSASYSKELRICVQKSTYRHAFFPTGGNFPT
jgi:hypothetical protein